MAPLHRVFSYPLSYVYCLFGWTPLAVTLIGLILALGAVGLLVIYPLGGTPFWTALALLNLGVIHDACDGEVARYRIHHKRQSTATYRVGIFADFWAFAIVVQALLPVILGYLAWKRGAQHGDTIALLGLVSAFLLFASYIAGFARKTYWPDRGRSVMEESLSLAEGGSTWLRLARRVYFYAFETAMFTTHATVVLLVWTLVGGAPLWAVAYVVVVASTISLAFLVGLVQTLQGFDREE